MIRVYRHRLLNVDSYKCISNRIKIRIMELYKQITKWFHERAVDKVKYKANIRTFKHNVHTRITAFSDFKRAFDSVHYDCMYNGNTFNLKMN